MEDNASTSRFVIVDEYEIAGGGIIREVLEDKYSWVRNKVILRNYKWEKSIISPEQRAEKYNQKSTLILVTGQKDAGKKEVAKSLESKLFADGKVVYFLGIGNVLYGVDADIKGKNGANKEEHLRRLAEVSHILMDAGVILIITARELSQDDLEIIKTTINPDKIETVWVGEDVTTDLSYDLKVPGKIDVSYSVEQIKQLLQDNGSIFKPW
jgi:bifunctional enzyme CysN/CysC